MNIQELYQELIIDHGTNPRNHYCPKSYTNKADAINSLCGDKLHIFLTLNANKITEISFTGTGCAISIASASIMTEMIKGKTIDEAKIIFTQFQDLLEINQKKEGVEYSTENLGKLKALAGVKQYPNRIKCATLAWHALDSATKQD